MRRLIYILVVVAIAAGVHFVSTGRENKKAAPASSEGPYSVRKMLENAPVIPPGQECVVSFNKGRATFTRGNARSEIALGDIFAAARTSDGVDFLGYITVNSGGSGTFRYLVLYSMTKQGLMHQDSAFLGDRVQVRSIQTAQRTDNEEYRVTASILDRKPDEPMSVPPVLERKLIFSVSDNRFIVERK